MEPQAFVIPWSIAQLQRHARLRSWFAMRKEDVTMDVRLIGVTADYRLAKPLDDSVPFAFDQIEFAIQGGDTYTFDFDYISIDVDEDDHSIIHVEYDELNNVFDDDDAKFCTKIADLEGVSSVRIENVDEDSDNRVLEVLALSFYTEFEGEPDLDAHGTRLPVEVTRYEDAPNAGYIEHELTQEMLDAIEIDDD